MPTITSGDSVAAVDVVLTGPNSNGSYTIEIQKPINPPFLPNNEIRIEVADSIVYLGSWPDDVQTGST